MFISIPINTHLGQELQADLERQRRVQANAALIEARDQQEREALRLQAATLADEARQRATQEDTQATESAERPLVPQPELQGAKTPSEMPQSGGSEPQSWMPRARTRGD